MRSTIFNIVFYAGTAVIAGTGYMMSFILPNNTMRSVIYIWGKSGRWGVQNILKGTVEIRGREHLPTDQPLLIAAKHQSELDVLITVSEFPDMTTVAMKTLEKTPFFGRIIRTLGYIMVDLSIPANRTQQVIDGARTAYDTGRPIVIYPEGTLMSLGAKERYRAGIWHIYNELGIKVTPVAMSVGVIWPRRDKVKFVGKTGAYEYLPPIEAGLDIDTFMARLESEIEVATMRLIEEHASGDILDAARDRYKRGVANEDEVWQSEQRVARQAMKKDRD